MSNATRVLRRAVWLTPKCCRGEREQFWCACWQAATAHGLSQADVSDAALHEALRLRAGHFGHTLGGRHGAWRGVGAWLGVMAVAVTGPLVWLLTWLVLCVGLAVVTTGARVGRLVRPALIAGLVAIGGGAGYLWWASGAGLDAEENPIPVPFAARFMSGGLLTCMAGVAVTVVCVIAMVRRPKPHRVDMVAPRLTIDTR